MFTTEDFIKKFELHSDETLLDINNDRDSYEENALNAIKLIIEKRGGQEKILKKIADKKIITNEQDRIEKETTLFARNKLDVDFIKTMLTSSIISKKEVDNIIEQQFKIIETEINLEKVTGKTVMSSVIAIIISSIIGGGLFGLQMIYSNRIFYIFVIGLAFFCNTVIKFITKKSAKNTAVLVSTIIAILLSILLGYVLFLIFGYRQ